VGDECVGVEHCFESLARSARSVSDFSEVFEVPGDLSFVPGEQDRFDVRKVLVQRRPSDARLLGDLRHRDGPEAVVGHQRIGGLEDGVSYGAAMRLDRAVPQPWHPLNVRRDLARHRVLIKTNCLVNCLGKPETSGGRPP